MLRSGQERKGLNGVWVGLVILRLGNPGRWVKVAPLLSYQIYSESHTLSRQIMQYRSVRFSGTEDAHPAMTPFLYSACAQPRVPRGLPSRPSPFRAGAMIAWLGGAVACLYLPSGAPNLTH